MFHFSPRINPFAREIVGTETYDKPRWVVLCGMVPPAVYGPSCNAASRAILRICLVVGHTTRGCLVSLYQVGISTRGGISTGD